MMIDKHDLQTILKHLGACQTGIDYALKFDSARDAYMRCTEPARLQWFLMKLDLMKPVETNIACFRILTEIPVNAQGQTIADLTLYSYSVAYATLEHYASLIIDRQFDRLYVAGRLMSKFMMDYTAQVNEVLDIELINAINYATTGSIVNLRATHYTISQLFNYRMQKASMCRILREVVSVERVRARVEAIDNQVKGSK